MILGYRYGQEVVKEWEKKGMLMQWQEVTKKPKARGRRNSI
jgi:hypothetical protein